MKLFIVRHGHVDGIDPPRFRGRAELPLTGRGQQQATALARRLATKARPATIYCSPLDRCIETASIIAKTFNLKIVTMPSLIDIDYGEWQGRTLQDVQASNSKLLQLWLSEPQLVRFPGGESLHDVAARAANVLQFLEAEHADNIVLTVGHDSINRVLLMLLLDMTLRNYWRLTQAPCCLNEVDIRQAGTMMRSINDTSHLDSV